MDKPVEKGYEINFRRVEDIDPYTKHHIEPYFSAVNEKEARNKALSILFENGVENDYLGDPLNYITVQVRRYPEMDRFLVDGKLKTRHEIERDKEKSNRDDSFRKLLADNPKSYAYIRKGGYYYQPNHCGYTEFQTYAGVYTLEEAVRACLGMSLCSYMRPILINVDEHNAMISKQIEGLKTRLILKEDNNNG